MARTLNSHARSPGCTQWAGILPSLTFPWIVSYDDAPQIRRLYRGYRRTSYSLRYTAAERRRGAEVILFSDGLVVPKGTWPSQGAPVRLLS